MGRLQRSQALMDKLQIIERYNHRTKRCFVLSQDDGTSSSDRRAIECPKAGNVRKTRQCAHRSPSDCWYCSATVFVLNTTADANSVVQLLVDEFRADCLRLSARPSLSRNRWNTASSVGTARLRPYRSA